MPDHAPTWYTGDLDADGAVTTADVTWLGSAVADPTEYELRYPEIELSVVGDIDGDGEITESDVTRLSDLITGL